MNEDTNHVLHYFLKNGDSGRVVGDHDDTRRTLIAILIQKYGARLDVDKTIVGN